GPSLPLDVAAFHDPVPARDLLRDPIAHLIGRGRCGHAAEAGEALPRLLLGENSARLAVQKLDYGARRGGRDREAEPGAELHAFQRLADRRYFGHQRIT